MRSLARFVPATLFALAIVRPAHALGPVDLEMAAKLGYATGNYGLAVGGRAGISLVGVYGGASVVNYFGRTQLSELAVGGEVGYGFRIAFITLRPFVGIGDLLPSVAQPPNGEVLGPGSIFYIQPGGCVELRFGHLLVGLEASALVPTGSGYPSGVTGPGVDQPLPQPNLPSAFTMNGQVGVLF